MRHRRRRGDIDITCRVPLKDIASHTILNNVELQQWDALRTTLNHHQNNGDDNLAKQVLQDHPKILLLACQYDAPSDVIQKIVDIKPELAQEKANDGSQQTPLHILCQKATPPASQERTKAIRVLAERYPQAAIIMDSNGNTPLHLICRTPCDSAHAVSAVEAVSLAGPAAMTMENHEDETPMEIFLLSQATAMTVREEEHQNEVLKVLNQTSIKYLSNFKSSPCGEMYRLKCCQQAVFATKRTSVSSATATASTCSLSDEFVSQD
eukprot:CAMPEP_0116027186 /NCGR_PEP_ID=MMETSP0321-20121206/14455_1 /TAXON_ID=163516 /ORGANISM="Leptocylindrus danicus var. danicus, Strain B650" /LENGTH=265 /DNA_ID=CAMNT_0003500445 /DNA_START=144 /DNA_END=941 /DNA_ORIENTATION=+